MTRPIRHSQDLPASSSAGSASEWAVGQLEDALTTLNFAQTLARDDKPELAIEELS